MPFTRLINKRPTSGRGRYSYPAKCDECSAPIEVGEVYYSKLTTRSRVVGHICKACYNRKFIVV